MFETDAPAREKKLNWVLPSKTQSAYFRLQELCVVCDIFNKMFNVTFFIPHLIMIDIFCIKFRRFICWSPNVDLRHGVKLLFGSTSFGKQSNSYFLG